MTTLASTEDFEARHGAIPAGDSATVEALLEDASSLVLTEVEGSELTWVTEAATENPPAAPRSVVIVCVESAYRAWSNPDGIVREQLGAAQVDYRGDRPGSIWLTKEERRTIRRAAGLGASFRAMTYTSPYSGGQEEDNDLPLDQFGS